MKETRLYATSVAIGGFAVLLIGPSGCGKSDLALRLIDRGASLVSDDYTALTVADGRLVASAPPAILGKIEVRGLGIIAVPTASGVPATLVIQLGRPVERLPLRENVMTIAGITLPEITLDAFEGSAAIKVELALHRATEGA